MPPDDPRQISGYGRVTTSSDSAGPRADIDPDPWFWAKIRARSGDAYSWIEQIPVTPGDWDDALGGRSGTTVVNPAYESSGSGVAPVGAIVRMRPRSWDGNTVGQAFIFEYCCVDTGAGTPDEEVQLGCCDDGDTLPQTVYIAFTRLAGTTCTDLVGETVELTYDDGSAYPSDIRGNPGWEGCIEGTGGPSCRICIRVVCDYSAGLWRLFMGCETVSGTQAADPLATSGTSCNPFELEFDFFATVISSPGLCGECSDCDSADQLRGTVTE